MSDLTTFRPGGARVVAYGVGVILLVVTFVVGLSLPEEIQFTPAEFVTLWLIILSVLAILHGVGRSYVRVGDDGVEVLNGYRKHVVTWDRIQGFGTNQGAPWPTMVIDDDERLMLFAIQGTDGAYAEKALATLRSHQP